MHIQKDINEDNSWSRTVASSNQGYRCRLLGSRSFRCRSDWICMWTAMMRITTATQQPREEERATIITSKMGQTATVFRMTTPNTPIEPPSSAETTTPTIAKTPRTSHPLTSILLPRTMNRITWTCIPPTERADCLIVMKV